jgi:hypothetical protein
MITWRRIPTLKTTLMKYLSQLKCLSVSVMAGYRFVIREDLNPEIKPNLGWNVVFSKGVSIFTGILTFSMTPSQSNLPGCCAWCLNKWISVSHLMTSVVGEENNSQGSLTGQCV